MPPLLLAIIVSAALGAVIGLMRQHAEQSRTDGATEFSGVRTFTFWSVLGCIGAYLTDNFSPAVLPVLLAAIGADFVVGDISRKRADAGSTTLVAALLTMASGALVHWKHPQEAILVSALTAVLLGSKDTIHTLTRKFTSDDIKATLKFIAITGIILPLVPNENYGPFDAFNPFKTWRMVVLISGVGFLGYVLMRIFSSRTGIILTSVLGGLASSTATTLAFSRRSRDNENLAATCAMGVAIACSVMLVRLLVIVGVVHRPLVQPLLIPCALMLAPGLLYIGFTFWRERSQKSRAPTELDVHNPLNLSTAIKFGLIYAAVNFAVKAARHYGQIENSLLPLSFVSGLTDVDAISLSIAGDMKESELPLELAARGIVVAAVSNTLLKTGMGMVLGSPAFRRQLLLALFPAAIAGAASLWLIRA